MDGVAVNSRAVLHCVAVMPCVAVYAVYYVIVRPVLLELKRETGT